MGVFARYVQRCRIQYGLLLSSPGLEPFPVMSPYWGEPEGAPHLWVKRKFVYFLFIYMYIYIWYLHIPCMHSALFVHDAIFPYLATCRAKLATFESQKEVVCTTHLWNPKKERKAKA